MSDSAISEMRAFNRFYTRVSGLLDEGLTRTRFTLPEARVLFELSASPAQSAGDIARAMGVDPAYVSRLLFKLTDMGLISVVPAANDRRRNDIHLTPEGRLAFAELDAASDTAAAALIEPLSTPQKQRLVTALRTVRDVLGDTRPGPLLLRPAGPGDVSHAIARQSALYAQEYGWDGTYEVLAADIAARFLADHDPRRETCTIAELAGEVAGSVFVVDAGEGIAQLRLLYVEPHARGHGIGRQLVAHAVRFSRANGYTRMRLWTQQTLTAARTIYAAEGFTIEESKAHRSFGKDLVGEWWGRDL